jgi:hypothetical protein
MNSYRADARANGPACKKSCAQCAHRIGGNGRRAAHAAPIALAPRHG